MEAAPFDRLIHHSESKLLVGSGARNDKPMHYEPPCSTEVIGRSQMKCRLDFMRECIAAHHQP